MTRRHFFSLGSTGIGIAALGTLLAEDARAAGGLPGLPHFPPTAKRVIYLFQHGAPSQLDLFDYKPGLEKVRGADLPESVRMGQRLTGMTAYQAKFPTAPSVFRFARQGECGTWLSELLPHTSRVADDICVIRSMQTDAINHDPGGDVLPDRISARREAEYRCLDLLRAGERKPGPARVRGDGLARQGRLAGACGPAVGQRVSAHQIPGREIPLGRRSRAVSFRSPGLFHGGAEAVPRRSCAPQ